MKRGFLSKILLFTVAITTIAATFTLPKTVKADETEQPNLVFPVISDVHIGGTNTEAKFQNTLQDLQTQVPNYDAIVTDGDNTNNGFQSQYDSFMSILNKYKVQTAQSIIAMGNHEYYSSGTADATDAAGYQQRFLTKTGMSGLNYDKWIKGYHFIILAPENLGNGGSGVTVTNDQLTWLDSKLKENEDPNKPAFVFLHQPMSHTVYGSDTDDNVENSDQLAAVLKQHPEAVYFSGHSHYLLEHPRTMYQNGFTMFDTGGIYYMMSEDDNYEPADLAEGLIVQVYNGKVVVKCREFSQHKWVGQTYTINYPFKPSPQDTKNPWWQAGSQAAAGNVTSNSAAINWPKAQDDTMVTSYKVINKNNGTSSKVINDLLKPEDATHSLNVNGLMPNTHYTFEVQAQDAFNNISDNNLSVDFTTAQGKQNTDPNAPDILDMDFANGQPTDSSSYGNSGTFEGNAKIGFDKAFNKNVLMLDGNKSVVRIPYNDSFSKMADSFTWASAFKLNTVDGCQDVVARTQSSDVSFELNNSKMELWAHIGGSYTVLRTGELSPNTIYHIAATYDGKTLKYYLNGTLVASASVTGKLDVNPNIDCTIGADPEPNHSARSFLNGEVDFVSMYSRALSDNDINGLYNKCLNGMLDKTQLNSALKTAQDLFAAVTVGQHAGQFSQQDYDNAKQMLFAATDQSAELTTQDQINQLTDTINNAIASFKAKAIVINYDALKNEVQNAQNIADRAVVGSVAGDYTKGSKDNFTKEISAATLVLNNANDIQSDVDTALSNLKKAETDFTNSVITKTLTSEDVDNNTSDITAALTDNNIKTINVDITKNSTVDNSVFQTAAGKNKVINFNGSGITWTFNGNDITNPVAADVDLSLKAFSQQFQDEIKNKVDEITGKDQTVYTFAFNYDGFLPGLANVKLFVGKALANKTLALRRYLPASGTFETVNGIDTITVDGDGYAAFKLNHCSEYFLTDANLTSASNQNNNSNTITNTNSSTSVTSGGTNSKQSASLPKTGYAIDMDVLLLAAAFMILAGLILIIKKSDSISIK